MIQKLNCNPAQGKITDNYSKAMTVPLQNTNNATVVPFKTNVSADKLALALNAMTIAPMAKTVAFRGLEKVFADLVKESTTELSVCDDEKNDIAGEKVGFKTNVSEIMNKSGKKLKEPVNALTEVSVDKENPNNNKYAKINLKPILDDIYKFDMAVRKSHPDNKEKRVNKLEQYLSVTMSPDADLPKVNVLNTKGVLSAVVKDNDNVLLTNSGVITKKIGNLKVVALKEPKFEPFAPVAAPVDNYNYGESIGEGSEVVIGMQEGRFCPEIIKSIEEFTKKLDKGEIVLPQFVAKKGAKDVQLTILAGGFGSRAEYTTTSADGIFEQNKNGAISTKGVFRTPTGLSSTETTFVSLHMAGLLDCSKDKFGIGKNVKLYMNLNTPENKQNKTNNKGNGGFSINLYNKMAKPGQKAEFIFPNDAISRMPKAISKVADLMNKDQTAVAMIAKTVPAKEAAGNFGIMKLDKDNQLLEFAEKPNPIPPGFADENDACLTNTFQFAVSKNAFKALSHVEPELAKCAALEGKETRDWSKQLIPIIMVLSQFDNPKDMKDNLAKVAGTEKDEKELDANGKPKWVNFLKDVDDKVLMEAKEMLNGQKVVVVPTEPDESWADVGQTSALYDTTIAIAKGEFKLLPFEHQNVLDSIDTQTGLVAMNQAQKTKIKANYDVFGKIMAIPHAKYVNPKIVDEYNNKDQITFNR